jgi:hypothetical protein
MTVPPPKTPPRKFVMRGFQKTSDPEGSDAPRRWRLGARHPAGTSATAAALAVAGNSHLSHPLP